MSNSLKNWVSQIGGLFASGTGGYLIAVDGTGLSWYMDVGTWVIQQNFEEQPLICSGAMGATDSRRVGYSYTFSLELVLDLRCPPDVVMRGKDGFELFLNLGDLNTASGASGGTGGGDAEALQNRFYWIPKAKLDGVTPMLDAQHKKMVRCAVTGRATSHIFLMPDMGNVNDVTTIAGAYKYSRRP